MSTVDRARLVELAGRLGVADSYVGWDKLGHEVATETLISVLAALGVDTGGPDWVDTALAEADADEWRAFLPAVTVAAEGTGHWFNVHVPHWDPVHVWITTEDGESVPVQQADHWVDPREIDGVLTGRASFIVPTDLGIGYHTLHAHNPARDHTVEAPLIVTPARLTTADALGGRQRWGLAIQLYSTRSRQSWGVGDLGDLARICEIAGTGHGADFVQINPLHAAEPIPPVEDSPYLPTTRRFVNPLYIRVQDIPEAARLPKGLRKKLAKVATEFEPVNTSAGKIKRNKPYRLKLLWLNKIYDLGIGGERAGDFAAFREREGEGLVRFATWCALAERYGARTDRWPVRLDDPDRLARKVSKLAGRIDFHCWLQWICDEQLAAADTSARESGMAVGVIADLAVGVNRTGADAWALKDTLAQGVSVGAPPDGFNQQGQDWSQPPWHPRRLAAAGYAPYRDMLRTILRHAGGVRVDHILGLFRLWWIPDGNPPSGGAYVRYDHNALIGILALEAQRAGAVVIGEDLGVFEPVVQDTLRDRGILGTSILWFEHGPYAPIPPEEYRALCLTAVTTHDLPPTLGYLAGDHIALRSQLGLLETGEEAERARDARDRDAILQLAVDRGLLTDDAELVNPGTVAALYRLIARSPSILLSVALVDAVGERRIQNQPGTTGDQYPNWRIPLADDTGTAVLVDDLDGHPRFTALIDALTGPPPTCPENPDMP
ncbi:4-alpha-glucanotransferase [Gordonia amarae]|uniref:4-alpha-glucanotransferase n=1 Tax=Gordonia amarae NBRC 15530 TaxID=1075090 RepID=G7GQM2_9ACTN|nr:4-alpha-glucanotransferase [Gordonia amarae]GAB05897.1 4-alpha-glucanotransferase [Gordonia amarae NBRC 15530]